MAREQQGNARPGAFLNARGLSEDGVRDAIYESDHYTLQELDWKSRVWFYKKVAPVLVGIGLLIWGMNASEKRAAERRGANEIVGTIAYTF